MTLRLINLVGREWASFDGMLAARGIDPLLLPADRMLNIVYWWATRNAEGQAQVDKFNRKLWMPPKGLAPPPGSPWSPEAETAAFQSLAAAFGVSAREGAPPPES